MPSPEHEAMVQQFLDQPIVDAPSLEEQRANYDALLSGFPIAPEATIEPIAIEHIQADWVSMSGVNSSQAILYLHGGGYVIGSNVGYREFASRLSASTGAKVCVINYRLAPEDPFPAAVDDALMAYQWLLKTVGGANNILIAGDSAGGGLALATLLAIKEHALPQPAGAVCFSPWVDLEGTGASAQPGAIDDPMITRDALAQMGSTYAPDDLRNPLAAPLYGDFTGLPPLQIHVGTREVLLDDSTRIAKLAKAQGVDVTLTQGDGLIHVWPVFQGLPEGDATLQEVGAFAKRQFANK